MDRDRRLVPMLLLAAGLATGAACGGGATSPADAGPDSSGPADSSVDSGVESGAPDVGTDGRAAPDAMVDAAADASPDAPSDAPRDGTRDAQTDAGDAPSGDAQETGMTGDASACATGVDNGADYTCAVRSDATLWCWGRNDYGQVGDGTTTYRTIPMHVTAVPPIQSVATGVDSACALTTGGAVWCWGHNQSGEVGNGTQFEQNTPVMTIASGVTSLAKGYSQHMCAIEADGSLWCWGSNGQGESGQTPGGYVLTPQKVAGLPSAVVGASVSDDTTCAITSDTALWCWGDDDYEQLGFVTSPLPWTGTPGRVTALGTGVAKVAAGFFYTCAVKTDGSLWCWGDNEYGQLGPEVDAGGTGTPAQVTATGTTVVDVSACENTCIRKTDGSVWCWGNNNAQQCGFVGAGTADPTQVVGVSNATAVASGVWNSCVITAGSAVECWGDNGAGELGIGMYSPGTATPTAPLLPCP